MKRTKGGVHLPLRSLRQNRVALLLYLLLTFFGTELVFLFEWERTLVLGIPPCVADVLCQLLTTYFFKTIAGLATAYLVLCMTKYDFTVPFILRQRDKRSMWLRQCGRIAGICLFTAVFVLAVVCLQGRLAGEAWINWGEYGSRYFATNEALRPGLPFARVAAAVGLGVFLMLYFLCLLWLLCRWLTDRHLAGWLVILVWVTVDGDLGVPVFIGKLDFSLYEWAPSAAPEWRLLPILAGCLALLAAGYAFAKRKDFLRVQQK
ncbi:MAG TPA: hypothetical protein H9674_07225 [Firmicutes bacterium]|nr:hypothetical protein [Bacillota bacterium]